MGTLGSGVAVERAWQQAAACLQEVINCGKETKKIMLTTGRRCHRLDTGSRGGGEDESLGWELTELARRLREQKQLGHRALLAGTGEKESMVYWLAVAPPPPPPPHQHPADASSAPPAPPDPLGDS